MALPPSNAPAHDFAGRSLKPAVESLVAYLNLTKPRLLPMVLFTALPVLGLLPGGWPAPFFSILVIVGVALAALWVIPYLWIPAIRPGHFEEVLFRWGVPFLGAPEVDPGPIAGGFDAEMLGASLVPVAVAMRMVGYGLVTPLFEELFMRSFVIRVAEVWGSDRDFRDVPIGFYSRKSFVAVIVIFTLAHLPWEYWVMVPWAILSTAWLYYRRHLMAVVVLHAATNASILVFVALASGFFSDGAGGRLSLWFFV